MKCDLFLQDPKVYNSLFDSAMGVTIEEDDFEEDDYEEVNEEEEEC